MILFAHVTVHSLYSFSEIRSLMDDSHNIQAFNLSVRVDRSVIQEDQTLGQIIRAYAIDVMLDDSFLERSMGAKLSRVLALDIKKLDLWKVRTQLITAVRLNITETVKDIYCSFMPLISIFLVSILWNTIYLKPTWVTFLNVWHNKIFVSIIQWKIWRVI